MKTILRLGFLFTFREKFVSKVILILLSVFSFTLFAIGSMGTLYSESEFMARGYRVYLEDKNYLVFEDREFGKMDYNEISLIEEGLELDFLSFYENQVLFQQYSPAYFEGDLQSEFYQRAPGSGEQVFAAKEEVYEKWGFDLLQGRYPKELDEVALSTEYFEFFQWGGYCNNFNGGQELKQTSENRAVQEEIETTDDLLGKKLLARDFKRGRELTIVGIVDAHGETSEELPRDFQKAAIFRSRAWREEGLEKGELSAQYIYVQKTEEVLKPATLKKIAKITCRLADENVELQRKAGKKLIDGTPQVGARDMNLLLSSRLKPTDRGYFAGYGLFVSIVSGAGIVFLIFSIVLNAHMVSGTLLRKGKEIGVLRALGASKGKVVMIFLTGMFYLALIVFLLSFVSSLLIYAFILKPLFTMKEFEVCLLQYNGWTVLLLFALSVGTLLLSALLPVLKFSKETIAENHLSR